jgi:hypothetical protein
MATPLKINNVGGDEIKEFTTAEENYIAYQIGLHLAAGDSSDEAALNKLSGGDSVGNYVNNFFNEPVGTHPSTSITSGSTTTTIFQGNGTAAETDSDVQVPIRWIDALGQTGFKQMPDSDINVAVDRYLSTIFTNDYPGVFKLASSSPGVDYSVHLSNAFTDTRTDGTSVVYNIYRRDSYSAPTTVRPLFVRDNAGFDGIQAMTDRQIKYSFGQRAKTRITASKIGTYQLRTASQGAPTDPGTWVSAGAATDTKQTTSQQNFSSPFTAYYAIDYTRSYTNIYTGNYQNSYASAYTRIFESVAYTRAYTAQYTNTYTGAYSKAYTSVFETPYTITFQNDYVRQQAETYTGTYQSTYNRTTYTGPTYNLDRTYQRNYTRNIDYIGPGLTGFAGYFNAGYVRNFSVLVNYTRAVTQYFDGEDFTAYPNAYQTYLGAPVAGTRGFAITRFGQLYVGPHPTLFPAPAGQGYYASRALQPGSGITGGSYYNGPGNPGADAISYESDFGIHYYGGDPTSTGAYLSNYLGPWGGGQGIGYLQSVPVAPTESFFVGPLRFAALYLMARLVVAEGATSTSIGVSGPLINDNAEGPYYTNEYEYWPTSPTRGTHPGTGAIPIGVRAGANGLYMRGPFYTQSFTGASTSYYQRNLTYQRNYTRAYTRNYTGIDGAYTRNYNIVPQFVGNFALNVNYISNYEGNVDFQGPNYERAFVGNYTSNYVRNYTSNYTGTYTNIFSGLYSRAFNQPYTTDYISGYTGTYTGVFSGDYATDYITDYSKPYTSAYEAEYATVYTGTFEGLTIDATSETTETYTLYVRIG